jgi:hypothetical protein
MADLRLPVRRVESWEDFTTVTTRAFRAPPLEPAFLFRGQADASWDLIPHFTRLVGRAGIDRKHAHELEQLALKSFRLQAHLYVPPAMGFDPRKLVSAWAVMQHYGVPTRLLDWSASPFVAAYFAVEQCVELDGAVVGASVPQVRAALSAKSVPINLVGGVDEQRVELTEKMAGRIYFQHLILHTDRMDAQQTLFSVSPDVFADHGQIISDVVPNPEEAWLKIEIPSTLKPEFMHRLRQMNITARSLFPGIEGLGRSVAELVRLGTVSKAAEVPEKNSPVKEERDGSTG